jgi:hypothetical protein
MPTLAVLRQLVKDTSIASEIAAMSAIVRQWESIAQLLSRKMDMERKYIARLEGAAGVACAWLHQWHAVGGVLLGYLCWGYLVASSEYRGGRVRCMG